MIRPAIHVDLMCGMSECLGRVSNFQIVMAISIQLIRPGCESMRAVACGEGIVERLGHFMAQGGDVLELGPEDAGAYPAREVEHVPFLARAVRAGLIVVGVESEHATLVRIAMSIQVRVRKEERGD